MFDFNNLVDRFLKRTSRPKTRGRYYPSEIGSCLRKVWYTYTSPLEKEPETIRIFRMGDMIHDFVADVLKSEKNPDIVLLEKEFPFLLKKEDYVVSGRVDNLILIKEGEKKILIEVKSTKSISYITEPHDNHVMQLQMYLHAFGIAEGMILYVEKNTLNSRGFPVYYNEHTALEVMKRFDTLHHHLTTDNFPEPEAKQKKAMNWMCGYCEYRQQCDEQTIQE